MRFKSGLALLQQTSSTDTWNVASFHSPHSLTWSWILSFTVYNKEWRRGWPMFWLYRTNQGPHWGLRIPFVGHFSWQQQQPMWYRDMYLRNRDELDDVKRERNVLARQVPPRPTERKIELVTPPTDP